MPRLVRRAVSGMTSAVKPWPSAATTVRQQPLTAMLSPTATSRTTARAETRRRPRDSMAFSATSPSSSTIPLNISVHTVRRAWLRTARRRWERPVVDAQDARGGEQRDEVRVVLAEGAEAHHPVAAAGVPGVEALLVGVGPAGGDEQLELHGVEAAGGADPLGEVDEQPADPGAAVLGGGGEHPQLAGAGVEPPDPDAAGHNPAGGGDRHLAGADQAGHPVLVDPGGAVAPQPHLAERVGAVDEPGEPGDERSVLRGGRGQQADLDPAHRSGSPSSPATTTSGPARRTSTWRSGRAAARRSTPCPPTAPGAAAPPITRGAMRATTPSTRPASKRAPWSSAPPSASRLMHPRAPRCSSSRRRSTRPAASGRVTTSAPASSRTRRRSAGARSVVAITAPGGPAASSRAAGGGRSALSTTTRSGHRPPPSGRRVVSSGSSRTAVPAATRTASWAWRSRCAPSRASGEVIHRDSPVWVAIRPSSDIANLAVT